MASSTNKLTIVMALADHSLRTGIKRVQKNLERLGLSIERAGKRSIKARPHLHRLSNTLDRVSASGKKVQQNLKGVRISFEATGRSSTRAGAQVRKGTRQMSTGLDGGRKSLARFSEALRTSIVNLRFLAVAFAGGALTGAVAKFGGEFEKSLTNIDTLLVDSTVSAKEFGESLKGLAATTPKDLLDLSSALYQILSAGVPASKAMDVLNNSTKLAISSISEVKDSANLLITTLNAYRGAGLSAADATDKLTRIYQLGRTTVAELSGSFGRVAPLAAQFGVDLDQVGGLMISLTRSGLRTNEAITATRAIISGIAKPTQKSQRILNRLGISFGQAAIDAHGFDGVMRNLLDSTGGNVDVLARLFPNIRALLPAVVTVGNGFEEFEENIRKVKDSFGATDDALDKSDGKFFKSAALLKSNFQNALVEISEKVLPVLRDEFDKLSDTINSQTGQTFIQAISDILVVLVKLAFTFGEVLRNAIVPFINFFQSMDPALLRAVGAIVLFNAVLRKTLALAAGSAVITKLLAAIRIIPAAFTSTMMSASTTGAVTVLQRFKAFGSAFVSAGVGAGRKVSAGIFTGLTTGQAIAKVAMGLSTLIAGAFRFFFAGFVVYTVVKSLVDMVFGETERQAEEAERKAEESAQKRLEEARRIFAQIERERRGASGEEIDSKRASVAKGQMIELTEVEAAGLRKLSGFQDKYVKEADKIISVQELYRNVVKGLTQDLDVNQRTEENLAEAREKALKLIEPIIESRIQGESRKIDELAPEKVVEDSAKALEDAEGRVSSVFRRVASTLNSVSEEASDFGEGNREAVGRRVAEVAFDLISDARTTARAERERIEGRVFEDPDERASSLALIDAQLKAFEEAIFTGKISMAKAVDDQEQELSTAAETFKRFGVDLSKITQGQITSANMSTAALKDPLSFLFQTSISNQALTEAFQRIVEERQFAGFDKTIQERFKDLGGDLGKINAEVEITDASIEEARQKFESIRSQQSSLLRDLIVGNEELLLNPEIDPERSAALREEIKHFVSDLNADLGTNFSFDEILEKINEGLSRFKLDTSIAEREVRKFNDDVNSGLITDELALPPSLPNIEGYVGLNQLFGEIVTKTAEISGLTGEEAKRAELIAASNHKRNGFLSQTIPLLKEMNVEAGKDLSSSVSIAVNLFTQLKNLRAQLASGKALEEPKKPKKPTGGRGRATNFQMRLEKALARLQQKTAKINRRNLVEAQKIAEKTANIRIKSLKREIELIKELKPFYGAEEAAGLQIEKEIRGLIESSQDLEREAQSARENSFNQRIANIKEETEESIKAEEKRLRANMKGNALRGRRRKANEKKIQEAISKLRAVSEKKRDQDIAKIEQSRLSSREESERRIEALTRKSIQVPIDRLKAQSRSYKDAAESIQLSTDALNQTIEQPTAVLDKLRAMIDITSNMKEQIILDKAQLDTEQDILKKLEGQEGKLEEAEKQKRKILGLTNKIAQQEAQVAKSVASQLDSALGRRGVINPLGVESEILEELIAARRRASSGADALGESVEFLDFNQRRMLESLDLLPSKMQEVRIAASQGIFGRRGGLISSFSSALQGALRSTSATEIGLGLTRGFFDASRSIGQNLLDAGHDFVSEVGSGLLLSARNFGPELLAAADQFTLSMVNGLSGIAVGEMSFVTDAASSFATESTKILQDSADVIGSSLGLSIGSALGDSDAGSEVGSTAGTLFGLAASQLIQGALSSVQRFVVSPIQGAISRPFEALSSGIGSVFDAFLGDSELSEEASRRRLELARKEHALRIDQINKEAEDKAAQIDRDLSLTEDIAKIQELTAKREEVRQERDQQLLEERRKAFEAEQSELKAQKEGPIDTVKKAVDNAMDIIDTLIEGLPSLAEEAVIGLTSALPAVIVGAAKALGDTLSTIAPLMGELIRSVVASLIDALPFILKGAADFVVGLVEGIIEGFIEILGRADEIIEPFAQALVSSVPRIIGALIAATPRIIGALIASIPLVVVELAKGLGALLRGIFVDAGKALLNVLSFGATGALEGTGGTAAAGAVGGALLGAGAYYGLSALFGASTGGLGFLAAGGIGAGIGAIASLFHKGGMVSNSLRNPGGAALFAGLGAPGFATGGMVDGIQNAISGSRLRAFRRGVDDVPAVLQAGEAVLNRRAVMNLGEDTINALNSGQTMDPGPTSINVSINPDAGGLNRVVSQLLPHLISGVNAEVDRPGSRLRISSMSTGRPMGTIRPRRG